MSEPPAGDFASTYLLSPSSQSLVYSVSFSSAVRNLTSTLRTIMSLGKKVTLNSGAEIP